MKVDKGGVGVSGWDSNRLMVKHAFPPSHSEALWPG